MAKRLDKIGVQTGKIIFAHEVSQSIDAFTGVEAYDINLSGSLNTTGSTKIVGNTTITGSLNTLGTVSFDNKGGLTQIKNGYLKITAPDDGGPQLGIQLIDQNGDPNNGLAIEFKTTGDDNTAYIQSLSDDKLKIGTAGRDRIFISSSTLGSLQQHTRVGVATNNPLYTLDVNGDFRSGDLVAENGSFNNITASGNIEGGGNLDIAENITLGGNLNGDVTTTSGSLAYLQVKDKVIINNKSAQSGSQSLTVQGSAVLSLPSGSKGLQDFQIMGARTAEWNVTQELTYFDDGYIKLKSSLNSLSCEIQQNPINPSSLVNIVYNNEGTYSYFDKQVSDGTFDLDTNFLDDETGIITIKAPKDPDYPFYRITVVRANISSYANNRIYAIIEKLLKPQPFLP